MRDLEDLNGKLIAAYREIQLELLEHYRRGADYISLENNRWHFENLLTLVLMS